MEREDSLRLGFRLSPLVSQFAPPFVGVGITPGPETIETTTQENEPMNITAPFKSAGHFLAKVFTAAVKDIPKVLSTETTVETVSAAIPGIGVPAVAIEKGAYAVLGEVGALLNAGGDAAVAKLQDAGLDINVINQVKALVGGVSVFTKLL